MAAAAAGAAGTPAFAATAAGGQRNRGGQHRRSRENGILRWQLAKALRQAQIEGEGAIHDEVHEALTGELVVAPLGFHDPCGKSAARGGGFGAGTGRNNCRASGFKRGWVGTLLGFVSFSAAEDGDVEAHRGELYLLPLLGVLICQERALRQVRRCLREKVSERIDDVQVSQDIVDHRDVSESLGDALETDKGGERFDGKDIELRPGRIRELNKLSPANLPGDCQLVGGNGCFDGVLPALVVEANGLHLWVGGLFDGHAAHCIWRRDDSKMLSVSLAAGDRHKVVCNGDSLLRGVTCKNRKHMTKETHDDLLARAFGEPAPKPQVPSTGDFDLAERNAFRRVNRKTTIRSEDSTDIYEVEYRKLRLEQVILVGVWTEGTVAEVEATMAELVALTETAGAEVIEALYQKRDKPDPGTYIGSGKVKELKDIVTATGADTVVCDGELTPGQLTALERALNTKVIDRTMLILDIFAQHAKSKEGKVQVSLAQLEYLYTHTRGWGGSLSRQAGGRAGSNGGVGLRGPGETKIETDRRRIRTQMALLRKELKGMKTEREIKRSRRASSTIAQIAIAGYTNAGKSSLINAMTGAGVLVEDALFATLDPTTRRAELGDGRQVVFTDTVGFVRHLPTQLVEAFKSTLEEVLAADLMLHVVDGSDPFPLKQIEAVNKVIYDIVKDTGEEAPPEIIVINKIDQADPLVLAELRHALDRDNVVYVSAKTGEGIDELTARVELFLNSQDEHVQLLVPFTRGDVVDRIHTQGTVRSEEYTGEGTLVDVRLPASIAAELREFRVAGEDA